MEFVNRHNGHCTLNLYLVRKKLKIKKVTGYYTMSKVVKKQPKTESTVEPTVEPTFEPTVELKEGVDVLPDLKEWVEDTPLRDQFEELIRTRNEDIRRLRDEIAGLKRMSKQYVVERKNATKRRKRPVDPNAPKRLSGFAKPSLVSDACYKFLAPMGVEKGSLISRTAVTKHIHEYINKNNLKNPESGREFFPDKKLKALLGEPVQFKDKEDESKGKMYATMGVQTYIKSHFQKDVPAVTA
jgi:hypothetical protein